MAMKAWTDGDPNWGPPPTPPIQCEFCDAKRPAEEMCSITRNGVTVYFCGKHEVTSYSDGKIDVKEKR